MGTELLEGRGVAPEATARRWRLDLVSRVLEPSRDTSGETGPDSSKGFERLGASGDGGRLLGPHQGCGGGAPVGSPAVALGLVGAPAQELRYVEVGDTHERAVGLA
jgi:hypothetical protein